MQIQFNGEQEKITEGKTLSQLLEKKAVSGSFAIAINQSFVPKSQYESVQIQHGDEIECVQAVHGG